MDILAAYLVKRSVVPLICIKPSQQYQLVPVFDIFNRTKLEDRAVCHLKLLEFLLIVLGYAGEQLNKTLDDDLFYLFQEACGLKGLARNIQRQILG
jgi:hypothetical protein